MASLRSTSSDEEREKLRSVTRDEEPGACVQKCICEKGSSRYTVQHRSIQTPRFCIVPERIPSVRAKVLDISGVFGKAFVVFNDL
jgi:hypothetical protein